MPKRTKRTSSDGFAGLGPLFDHAPMGDGGSARDSQRHIPNASHAGAPTSEGPLKGPPTQEVPPPTADNPADAALEAVPLGRPEDGRASIPTGYASAATPPTNAIFDRTLEILRSGASGGSPTQVAPPEEAADHRLPARMLNEFVYCPRLFYYEHVEGVFVESADTIQGAAIHKRVDSGTGALPGPVNRAGEVTGESHRPGRSPRTRSARPR